MQEKEKKPAPQKAIWSSVKLSLLIYWHERKSLLIVCALAILMRVAAPYLTILMPRVVIDQIQAGAEPLTFILIVGGMALLLVAVNYLRAFSDNIANNAIGLVGFGSTFMFKTKKMMSMDYELMESPDFIDIEAKAARASTSSHSLAMNIPRTLVRLLSNILGFLLYAGVIILIHPLILLILLATSAVNWFMLRRVRMYMQSTRHIRSKQTKKLQALSDTYVSPKPPKIYAYTALLIG